MSEAAPSTAATATSPMFRYYSTLDGTTLLDTPDGRTLAVNAAPNRPPIVIDPEGIVRGGRPTSVYDLLYEQCLGVKLDRNKHAVPKKNADGTRDWANFDPAEAEVLTSQQIHKEATAGKKTKTDARTAGKVKTAHFVRGIGPNQMAGLKDYGGLSATTLRAILKGEAYWYA